jgi:regulatory protein
MGSQITALRFQQRDKERVNLYLDGEFACAIPALEAARLRIGQALDAAELQRLQRAGDAQRAYQRGLQLLSFRPRSTAEVRQTLARAQFSAEAIDQALADLERQGYLNDAEFTRFWVENRQRFRPKGAQALRQELRLHGVAGDVIEPALAALDAESAAYAAAQPRAVRLRQLALADPPAFRRKLGDFLSRRGFDYETVRSTLARLNQELSLPDTDASSEPDDA